MLHTITSTLPPVHGGRTKSLLNRVKFLEEKLNEQSTIHTTNYNPDYLNIYEDFKKRNIISNNLVIRNLYEWLSGNNLLEKHNKTSIFSKSPKQTSIEIHGLKSKIDNNIVRYYNGNEYTLYRKFYKGTKVLNFEDYMSPISKKRLERREYTRNGVLHRIINYSPINYNKVYEEYYNKKGEIYLKKHFSDHDRNKLLCIILYRSNKPLKFFKNEKEMFTYYFNNVLKDNDVVFNDARLLDKSLMDCNKNLKRVLVFHSTHFVENGIRNSYKLALNNSDKISKYIVLTDYQKNDIQSEFDINDDKIKVIPHFVETLNTEKTFEKSNQFCYVGRISKEKQIDHIIKAFKIYIEKGNNSMLLIYGKDEHEELNRLTKLVQELGLTDYIEFKGYTSNPAQVFEKSIASILTSKFEGFGLTVMESINNGCPVLSYNIRYGSSELIDNYKNGILVEQDNINDMAKAMENARYKPMKDVKLSGRFSLDSAIRNYKELVDELNY